MYGPDVIDLLVVFLYLIGGASSAAFLAAFLVLVGCGLTDSDEHGPFALMVLCVAGLVNVLFIFAFFLGAV